MRREGGAGGARREPERLPAQHCKSPAARPTSRSRRSSWRPTTAAAASSTAWPRSSPAAIPASAARSRCCLRAKAPTSPIVYLDEHEDAQETKRCVEAEGRRCLLIAGDVKDSKFCREGGRQDGAGVRPARRPGQQRRVPGACASRSKTSPTSAWKRRFRTNIFGYFYMARAALPHLKKGALDHQHRSVAGLRGQPEAARLFGHQGRDPRLHDVAGAEPDRQGHPRQRGRAGPGLDAAQSGRRLPRRSPSSASRAT